MNDDQTRLNVPIEGRAEARIQVLRGELGLRHQQYVIGVIRVEDLVEHFRIARRETLVQVGYQRDASPTRVNNLSGNLRDGRVDLPTAILLNLRDFDATEHLSTTDGGFAKLRLRVGDTLHVVDGQHRVEALKKLFEEDAARWAEYTVPFVCLLGANEGDEMEEFYVVNSNAKSVSTSLAFDLLKQRAVTFPKVMDELVAQGKAWQPLAEALVEDLSGTGLWKGRIRFPLQPKADTMVNNNAVASSLKPLLSSPFFGGISNVNQIKVLSAYWEAIRQVLPGAFVNPSNYAIQKSLGVTPIHRFLVEVLEVVRSKNWSVTDPESFREVIRPAFAELSGDLPEGATVEGEDFWRSGAEGAAGSYSSHAGQRVLLARLRQNLPKISVN